MSIQYSVFSLAAGQKDGRSKRKRNFMKFHSRSNDPTRTESLNAEHSKRSLNAIANRYAVLHFGVWPHEEHIRFKTYSSDPGRSLPALP